LTILGHLRLSVPVLCLAAAVTVVIPAAAVAQSTPSPSPVPAAADVLLPPAVDQNAIYDVPRSYALLNANYTTSFPDFYFFLGFNGMRNNTSVNGPPTYVPQCTAGTDVSGKIADSLTGGKLPAGSAIGDQVVIAYQNLTNALYRFRICDFNISVYAWNTRNTKHTETFNYSWRSGCNSFHYEKTIPPNFARSAAKALQPGAGSDDVHQFLVDYEAAYDDLYQRLSSCAALSGALTYPPNNHRFICKYGSFIGAFVTAYSAAFGHKWGPSSNGTQSEVTAFGTVMIASPNLCQK
jgi:hypothetical protein